MILNECQAVVEVKRSVETLAAKAQIRARGHDPRVEQNVARADLLERVLALDDAGKRST